MTCLSLCSALIVTLFCLEHQSAVSIFKLGYTSCSSAYSDLGFCCYGEPDSSTDSIHVSVLDPVAIAGNSVLGRFHNAFNVAVNDTLFELQTDCTELHMHPCIHLIWYTYVQIL